MRNPGAAKRQKELARQQKRQDKLVERARRNAEKKLRPAGAGAPIEEVDPDLDADNAEGEGESGEGTEAE
ncbi:MAG: hypothetical protein IPK07_34205 [Deltaproteobacteria bacterium]|nr:hypothetical protein [Deltaproteobacteria bacterium]